VVSKICRQVFGDIGETNRPTLFDATRFFICLVCVCKFQLFDNRYPYRYYLPHEYPLSSGYRDGPRCTRIVMAVIINIVRYMYSTATGMCGSGHTFLRMPMVTADPRRITDDISVVSYSKQCRLSTCSSRQNS
jgi:hypothetical protein